MSRSVRLAAAVLAAIALSAMLSAGSASAAVVTVIVGPGGATSFSPANATIQTGDTVHWVWRSTSHSTTSGSPQGTPDGRWDSKIHNQPFSFDHTFTNAGTFHYFCSVHVSLGMVGSITVSPDEPPSAAFTVATPSPVAGQPVSFDGSASSDPDGTIASHSWDFGDGTPAGSGAMSTHVYAAPGNYLATLTVTDSTGATASVSRQVVVGSASGDEPPSALVSVKTHSPVAGQAVFLDASGSSDPDGSITSYAWNFADGSTPGTGVRPSHTYDRRGTYLVRLTITDSAGLTAATMIAVEVGGAGKITRVSLHTTKHGTFLVIRVNSPGVLKLRLFKLTHTFRLHRAGTLKFQITLTKSARATLQQDGRLKARVKLQFAPEGGGRSTKTLTLTLVELVSRNRDPPADL